MRCIHCGTENPDYRNFCRTCGSRLKPLRRDTLRLPGPGPSPQQFSKALPSPFSSLPTVRQSRNPRGFWLLVSIGGLLLVFFAIWLSLTFLASPATSTTANAAPQQMLLNYCAALKSGNYQQAYEQLSSNMKQQMTEADFVYAWNARQSKGKILACTVNNGAGTSSCSWQVSVTFANGSGETDVFTLVVEQNEWKIYNQCQSS